MEDEVKYMTKKEEKEIVDILSKLTPEDLERQEECEHDDADIELHTTDYPFKVGDDFVLHGIAYMVTKCEECGEEIDELCTNAVIFKT